jgi:hypothetical protein
MAAVLVLVWGGPASGVQPTAQASINQALAPALVASGEDRALAVAAAITGGGRGGGTLTGNLQSGYLPVMAATAAAVLVSSCHVGPIHVLCTALVPIKKRRLVLGLAQLPMLVMLFLLLIIVR